MRFLNISKYIFSLIGIAILIGAYYFYNHTKTFLNNSQIATGTVTELVKTTSNEGTVLYQPRIKFTADNGEGITFTSGTASNPPSHKKGDEIEVYYQIENPQNAKVKGFFTLWAAPSVMAVIGLSFFLLGFSMLTKKIRTNKKVSALKANGQRVKAKIKHIGLNTSYKVNGQSPYQIKAQWQNPATSKVHVFNSEYLWYDPTDYVNEEEITVLIDKNNPRKYHMDISFLPQLAK